MPEIVEENIILSRSARVKDDGKQVIKGIQETRDARQNPAKEIPIEGELRARAERDIHYAESVLVDIGYTSEQAVSLLPTLDQIHFYQTEEKSEKVGGSVANEGGRLEMQLAYYVSDQGWEKIGPIFTHELGHYPAQRVYGLGIEDNSPMRLISFGFDVKKRYVNIMGTQYFQQDKDDIYMNGVLREPLADLFGYYTTEKRGESVAYPVNKYYRETAFTIALLQRLSNIRHTSFFDEFALLYRSFNNRDYHYFAALRDDFAQHFTQEGLSSEEASKKATEFVSGLNKIQSIYGRDCVQISSGENSGDTEWGGQMTRIAAQAGFLDEFSRNIKAINRDGLVLDGATTIMIVN